MLNVESADSMVRAMGVKVDAATHVETQATHVETQVNLVLILFSTLYFQYFGCQVCEMCCSFLLLMRRGHDEDDGGTRMMM